MSANAAVRAELDQALARKTPVNYRPEMEALTGAPWRTGAISSVVSLSDWVSNSRSRDQSPNAKAPPPTNISSQLIKHIPGISLPSPLEWTVCCFI